MAFKALDNGDGRRLAIEFGVDGFGNIFVFVDGFDGDIRADRPIHYEISSEEDLAAALEHEQMSPERAMKAASVEWRNAVEWAATQPNRS